MDNLTEIEIYCFEDDEAIGFGATNVRSAMIGLDILFSAGIYSRLGDQSASLPKQLSRPRSSAAGKRTGEWANGLVGDLDAK